MIDRIVDRTTWLKALEDCLPTEEDDQTALTTFELAELFGIGVHTIRRKLIPLIKQQRVIKTRKRVLMADGRKVPVAAYKLCGEDQ